MSNLVEMTVDLVAVYLQRNDIGAEQVSLLIRSVYGTLKEIDNGLPENSGPQVVPPVPIESTVTPDYIISLEDGKPYKTLGRHLLSRGLTPKQYRAKWGLDPTYPIVAPNYSAKRSSISRTASRQRKAPAEQDE